MVGHLESEGSDGDFTQFHVGLGDGDFQRPLAGKFEWLADGDDPVEAYVKRFVFQGAPSAWLDGQFRVGEGFRRQDAAPGGGDSRLQREHLRIPRPCLRNGFRQSETFVF